MGNVKTQLGVLEAALHELAVKGTPGLESDLKTAIQALSEDERWELTLALEVESSDQLSKYMARLPEDKQTILTRALRKTGLLVHQP